MTDVLVCDALIAVDRDHPDPPPCGDPARYLVSTACPACQAARAGLRLPTPLCVECTARARAGEFYCPDYPHAGPLPVVALTAVHQEPTRG